MNEYTNKYKDTLETNKKQISLAVNELQGK